MQPINKKRTFADELRDVTKRSHTKKDEDFQQLCATYAPLFKVMMKQQAEKGYQHWSIVSAKPDGEHGKEMQDFLVQAYDYNKYTNRRGFGPERLEDAMEEAFGIRGTIEYERDESYVIAIRTIAFTWPPEVPKTST